jgi:hypothetical protein
MGQHGPVSHLRWIHQVNTIQSSDSQLRWGSDLPIFTFGGELALSQHGELRTESTPTVEIRSTGMAIVPHADLDALGCDLQDEGLAPSLVTPHSPRAVPCGMLTPYCLPPNRCCQEQFGG